MHSRNTSHICTIAVNLFDSMKKSPVILLIFLMLFSSAFYAQGGDGFSSEEDLKKQANTYFEEDKLLEAKPLFAQLLSLYPQDPNYNYKYGACLLASSADKSEPLKYLQFAVSRRNSVDDLANYYLGKAHHLNYNFAKAVKAYSKYKRTASAENLKKYEVERQIEMCKNGNQLLSKLNDVQVLEKQEISEDNFFRIYELEGIDGRIIAKPQDFKSKYDNKIGEKSIIYLPSNANEVYYSSYGKKGDNGKDIYKSVKLNDGNWSEGVPLNGGVNTPYDEDYPFIHPDGRTLYFASKGHSSMGGFDLFKSTFDQQSGSWLAPENLDFAFSSADDDILFVTDKDQVLAYFASNRTNESGKITVYKVLVEKAPAELTVIKGVFVAESNPELKAAKITVVDSVTNKTIGVFETDKQGNYKIEIAKNGGTYKFLIETTEDAPIHSSNIQIPNQEEFEVLGQELMLVEKDGEQQLVIRNIFDGTAASNYKGAGPQVSAQTLRSRARLEVNADVDQLAINSRNNNSTPNNGQENSSSSSQESNSNTGQESNANTTDKSAEELSSLLANNRNTIIDVEQNDNKFLNTAYQQANANRKEAEKLFDEVEQLESSGTDEETINSKRQEAEEMATKSQFTASLANKIENQIKRNNSVRENIRNDLNRANDNIQAGQLANADNSLNQSKEQIDNMNSVSDFIEEERNSAKAAYDKSAKELNDLESKITALESEKEQLEEQLVTVKEEITKTSGKALVDLQDRKQQIELDLKDIDFQLSKSKEEVEPKTNEKMLLEIKQNELVLIDQKGSSQESIAELGAAEKESMNNVIQQFIDNDQLAYIDGNSPDLSANQTDSNTSEPSSAPISSSASIDVASSSYNEINDHFENKINGTNSTSDDDLQKAQQIKLYDEWSSSLNDKLVEREAVLSATSDPDTRSIIQLELDNIVEKINEIENSKSAISDELTIDSQPSTSNQGSVSNQSTESIKTGPIDISEVNQNSIVDDSFSNFTFDQTYDVGNQTNSQDLLSAKVALFEAKKIFEQADEAREAAYNLPTIEQRQAAFDRANELEKASELKQLEAANAFANYNATEFQLNKERLANANQFGEEFESDNLEIANLLAEEAEVYFEDASEIRAAINPSDRLSKKEADLQKAYDYEMLALRKQREALNVLEIVDDEYLNQPVTASTSGSQGFVQTITDAEVLAVNDAELARKKGDSLQAAVVNLENEIQIKEAEIQNAPEGSARDSLLAITEELKTKADQERKKAETYYERENQLNSGSEAQASREDQLIAQITKPRKINAARVIQVDTVNVDEDREQLVLESESFLIYAKNEQEVKRLISESEVEYVNATNLAKEKARLEKQAIVEREKANATQDEAERERIIKQAEVIDLKAKRLEGSIDSLEKIIKIKNYLISSAENRKNASLANLSPVEQGEIVSLFSKYEGDPQLAERIDQANLPEGTTGGGILGSSATSQEIAQLDSLGSDNFNLDQVPLSDEALANEANNDGQSTLKYDERPEGGSGVSGATGGRSSSSGSNNANRNTTNNKVGGNTTVENTTPSVDISAIDVIPEKINRPIFLRLNSNESAYNDRKPIPLDVEMPEGLVYKVQVGAFRNPLPPDHFKGFAPLTAESNSSGITRYTAGFFLSEGIAVKARDEIRAKGYSDAFVVAFLNGERISIVSARNQGGSNTSSEEAIAFNENASSSPNSSTSNTTNVGKVEGGSKEGLNAELTAADAAEVKNTETIEGLVFTVQIGVYSKAVKSGTFSYQNLHVVQLPGGMLRYNAGIYQNAIDAADAKINIQGDISDAFVVAYYNGKRITLNEAARIRNNE